MTNNRFHLSVALLVGALFLSWLLMLLFGTGPLDHDVLRALYGGHLPVLADAARLITMLGDGRVVALWTVIGAFFLFRRHQQWPAIVLVVGPLLGKALTEIQKYEFNRLRPDEDPHLVVTHNLSFPSGHSANAMMTYVALALFLCAAEHRRPWLAAAISLALVVGISRVVLGVHWPSDVVGGWSYGLLWAIMLYALSKRPMFRR